LNEIVNTQSMCLCDHVIKNTQKKLITKSIVLVTSPIFNDLTYPKKRARV
jgi:hypothetical protein